MSEKNALFSQLFEDHEKQEQSLGHNLSLMANAFVNTNDLSKNEYLDRVFNTVFELIPEAQKGSFYELDEERYRPIFSKGYDLELLEKLPFFRENDFDDYGSSPDQEIDAYMVYVQKRDDTMFSKETIEVFKALGTYSEFVTLYAPIKVNNTKVGILCLENFTQKSFSENAKQTLRLCAQLISNFYGIRLHQLRERENYKEVIAALVSAIEVKDTYTIGHAKRVTQISIQIAQILKLPANKISMLETAALLHDVGKIGIPTEILIKPDKLTNEEYEIVKKHPNDAKKILENISGFKEIIEMAIMHHEHYDGTGYPSGTNGLSRSIESQIIQVADALDAMTSDRSYRNAMCIRSALDILQSQKGKQFHPEIIEAVIELYRDFVDE